MEYIYNDVVEFFFASALFINAMLFLPQAWKVFKHKRSGEVSLITFGGFLITQLLTVIHASIKNDYVLLGGYILAMSSCGLVVALALYYRIKNKFLTKKARI